MPIKLKNHRKLLKVTVAAAAMITMAAPITSVSYQAHAAIDRAYDLSEFQGYLSAHKVKELKREVGFVILRTQYGGLYQDRTFRHNAKLMQKYHVPYGVYSYSLYANAQQAREAARNLHKRAPKARFYVNDLETNNAGSDLNYATRAWSKEMHRISSRPTVLYSGLYFMNDNITQGTRNSYNAIWLADYSAEPDPSYHYDLWQFSNSYYSRALGQALDADTFPQGSNKPLSFWIGNGSKRGPSGNNKSSNVKPLNNGTAKATIAAQKAAITKLRAENATDRATIKRLQKQEHSYRGQAAQAANNANSESQKMIQLQNENQMQSQALQKDTNSLNNDNSKLEKDQKLIDKLEHKKPATRSKFSDEYYRYQDIHDLKVINHGGINIYDNNNGHKITHVKCGTILHVRYFYPEFFGNKLITRAKGYYGRNNNGSARKVVFTSNKNFVKWY